VALQSSSPRQNKNRSSVGA